METAGNSYLGKYVQHVSVKYALVPPDSHCRAYQLHVISLQNMRPHFQLGNIKNALMLRTTKWKSVR